MKQNEKLLVIKCGGTSLEEKLLEGLAQSIHRLQAASYQVILVHGGGKEITQFSERLCLKSTFVQGLRYTSSEVLKVSQMVLLGILNPHLVTSLQKQGIQALGLAGHSGLLLQGDFLDKNRLGWVGSIHKVNTSFLRKQLALGLVPVISPIAVNSVGESLNVNADSAAACIAGAMKAQQLILFSDVDGFYEEYPNPASRVAILDKERLAVLLSQEELQGGMRPKLQAAQTALLQGTEEITILDMQHAEQLHELVSHKVHFGTRIV